jgi:hypothetical protein
MEFKVKEVSSLEERSVQEVEKTLLEKHEEKLKIVDLEQAKPQEALQVEKEEVIVETPEPIIEEVKKELQDTDVLSYINNRYNKKINSVDELFSQKNSNEELPEEVSKYLKFKKETGRGFDDFIKVNKNYDTLEEDKLLIEYYSLTEKDLDSDDINYLIEDKFSFDEELDDEKVIKKKNIAKKRELSKAKEYLNELKDKYSVPLESSGNSMSEESLSQIEAYKGYIQESQSVQEANQKKSDFFSKKTDEVFNSEFKGFEFNVGDKKVNYAYGDVHEMKSKQSDLNNFVNKFLDEDGLIKDAKGWHKSISAAMNPDNFAQYFYEQGKADAIGDVSRKSKNINMDVRKSPQVIGEGGFKAKAVSEESGRGLKIKSRR